MTSETLSPLPAYTEAQIEAWLQGLLAIAWSDGDFDPQEQELIAELTLEQMNLGKNYCSLELITPEKIAQQLGDDPVTADNFMRTAVMVAIADGVYTRSESQLLHRFAEALNLQPDVLASLEHTIYLYTDKDSIAAPANKDDRHPDSLAQNAPETAVSAASPEFPMASPPSIDVLNPVREWLDGLDVQDPKIARFLCKLIPAQCPFERDINLFGRKVVHIPPMCKINPLYEQLVGLRFRALCYLSDECHEDITSLIQ
ncbi:MAG: nitrogenase [Coleofasciculaceae cyanobacterium SM2_1_6]|nr:nitrogenase [Coleofasciculaceae cyanobacterium SM2_1_6]